MDRLLDFLAGPREMQIEEGETLRLLTAMEVLEARREATARAGEDRDRALCSNACLVARAVVRRGRPVYGSGEEVLHRLTVGQVETLARRWMAFYQEEGLRTGLERSRLDQLKKAWSTCRGSAFGGMCSNVLGRCRRRNGPRR